jgi:hypothetical protein
MIRAGTFLGSLSDAIDRWAAFVVVVIGSHLVSVKRRFVVKQIVSFVRWVGLVSWNGRPT